MILHFNQNVAVLYTWSMFFKFFKDGRLLEESSRDLRSSTFHLHLKSKEIKCCDSLVYTLKLT